ncbi:MAG: hypothetical protein ABSG17_06420 [Spirochaetia bacterium]|jgi:energy-coupling factor transporter ATP-binding protein EcfA2
MEVLSFTISNYRAIADEIKITLKDKGLIPLVGINECGKTTILQAMFSFDFINDNEYGGKHLQNTLNLYQTEDKEPLIVAELRVGKDEMLKNLSEFKSSIIGPQTTPPDSVVVEKLNTLLPDSFADFSSLTIQTNLAKKSYSFTDTGLKDLPADIQDSFCKFLISLLPYILYNDDFTDRPETSTDIPALKPDQISGWLSIYETLFHIANPNYSLFSLIAEKDDRRKESILSDVQEYLNHTLTEAWKTFHLGKREAISVKLTLTPNPTGAASPYKLNVRIVEKLGTKDRFFDVIDRSKGFLWFYNFVMKLQFNPKVLGRRQTIYLLDEPGSYLHSSAQEKLCAKIKEISDRQGFVIYCTHSHHLLNPDRIPLSSVYIVEKEKDKRVKITPLAMFKTKSEKTNALQPILEALHIPSFEFFKSSNPLILLEGIYDKYALELFSSLDLEFNVFPGVSADSIIKNIQLMIAYGRVYCAIWDNDKEGRENFEKAKKLFGEKESEKFSLLPQNNPKKTRMEEMFAVEDFAMMKTELGLPEEANYETLISSLYYAKSGVKKRVIGKVSPATTEHFGVLRKVIVKLLKAAEKPTNDRAQLD